MTLDVIAHSNGCEGGTCPTIWRCSTTGDVQIRGFDPLDPTTELDVVIPAPDWAFLLTQLPR